MTISNPSRRRLLTAGLILVSVLALVRLIAEVTEASGGSDTPAPAAGAARAPVVPSGASSARTAAAPVRLQTDVELRLDRLKAFDARALPDFTRNPFQYGPTPQQLKELAEAKQRDEHPAPPAPPPPPPVPFKALGYQTDGDGKRTAYLSDEQDTYLVREGQQFGQRFKVLKISDASVEVEDESYRQIVQLPYPQ